MTELNSSSVVRRCLHGARGAALRPGELAALAGQLGCWREVAGISDPMLAAGADARTAGPRAALPLDEGLLGSWTGPFGWLVIGEPLTLAELRTLSEHVGSRQRVAEGAADRYPEQAALARRLKERHAEFQRGESAGFWRVSILAGGAEARDAARVAGLVCASADLTGLPYALSPAPVDPPGRPASAEAGGDAVPSSPFCGSTELLAALARPPEAEVPGVRLVLQPEFDVTPEVLPESGVELGSVLDRTLMPAGPFTCRPTRSTGTCLSAGRPAAGSRRPCGRYLSPLPRAGSRGWLSSRPRPSTG
jgi:hypothetical protein